MPVYELKENPSIAFLNGPGGFWQRREYLRRIEHQDGRFTLVVEFDLMIGGEYPPFYECSDAYSAEVDRIVDAIESVVKEYVDMRVGGLTFDKDGYQCALRSQMPEHFDVTLLSVSARLTQEFLWTD